MKKIRKVILAVLFCVMSVCGVAGFSACSKEDIQELAGSAQTTLSVPTGLRIESGCLAWNPVEYASQYTVSIDGREYFSQDYKYPLTDIADGEHVFKVKANGDGILYLSSAFSDEYLETIVEGAKASTGYYGQFDELTKEESFLGYGFDVINSAVFSDKYVKTSFPIFDTDELMNLRLLKVDSKQSQMMEIKSSSMDSFMQQWNAAANVNVGWNTGWVGGSVDVDVKYSGGVENAKSKYFHCISFYNQKFYIVMQGDINTYKSILSEGFLNDLYSSDMTAAQLFDRYGTHFITSAVMGGKINSYYLYSSEQEKSYHDISGKVSVEVTAYAANVNVDISGGYRNEARSENIDIKNTLEVIGGGDFGMRSDADIAANYAAWEKSLDDHASLMGIKDTGSLVPLWELVDASLDTNTYTWTDENGVLQTGSRAQELQGYFRKYGLEAYNGLMKSSGLPEIEVPESIDSIMVNNQESVNGEYEVFAGTLNDISFHVNPETAVGFEKTVALGTNTAFARIDNKTGLALEVDVNCPHNTVLQLILSCGGVRETINVRVVKRYTVTFESNGGSSVDSIFEVTHGQQIDEPTQPIKNGYIFKGWYLDPNFADETKYEFGRQAIVDNTTLYAKWEKFVPSVTFIHNVDGCDLLKDSVEYGSVYQAPSISLEGYNLIGFYSNQNMSMEFDFTKQIKENITIYVKWEAKSYKVTFQSNGGSAVDAQTVYYNDKVVKPTDPTRSKYVFMGWYKDSACTDYFDFQQDVVDGNMTLYALWGKDNIDIQFQTNGGTAVDARRIEAGDSLGELPVTNKEYYIFEGWYSNSGSKVTEETVFDTSCTLYAKWSLKVYEIVYESNDGGLSGSYTTLYSLGDTVTFATTDKEYYTFGGWYLDEDFTQKARESTLKTNPQDVVLYAKWELQEYTITYNFNGGTVTDSNYTSYYVYGQTIVLPGVRYEYRTFDGWYEDSACTVAVNVNALSRNPRNLTLYAKWLRNSVTVTFNSNGGTAVSSRTLYAGDTLTLPNSTQHLYNLASWSFEGANYSANTTIIVKKDMNFVAQWQRKASISGTYNRSWRLTSGEHYWISDDDGVNAKRGMRDDITLATYLGATVETLRAAGFTTLTCQIQLAISERDDGYQEMYISNDWSKAPGVHLWGVSDIEHGPGYTEGAVGYYNFTATLNLADCGEILYFTYEAWGDWYDSWYNEGLYVVFTVS